MTIVPDDQSSPQVVSLADRIREFVWRQELAPVLARSAGAVVVVRAGEVHRRMLLKSRLPAVCAALESKIMAARYGVEVVKREGPHQGATAVFHFERRAAAAALSPPPSPPATLAVAPSTRSETTTGGLSRAVAGTVFMVSCVKTKRNAACAAKDLYVSDWFRSARAYVEGEGAPWLILSAEYGLLHPDQVVRPYDKTLKTMPVAERRRWAERVATAIDVAAPSARQMVFLAGASYREFLELLLSARGLRTESPMSALRQGEQLSWLKRNTKHHRA